MNAREEQIHQWAEYRSFEELTAQELEVVLSCMTEEDYRNLHQTIVLLNENLAEDEELVPRAGALAELQSNLSHSRRKTGIPIWHAKWHWAWTAAACILVFFVGYSLRPKQIVPEIQVKDRIVEVERVDTLYLEKPVYVENVKTVYVEVPAKEANSVVTSSYEPDESELVKVVSPVPDREGIARSFGNSNIQPEQLERFRVAMEME